MTGPTWQHAVAVVACVAAGWLVSLGAERAVAAGVRRAWRRWHPMLEEAGPVVRYERSLFTPGVVELQAVHVLLCLAGVGLWLGLAQHPMLHATAAATWLAALALDLWAWQGVEVDDWHVAWRRGVAAPTDDGRPQRQAPPVRRLPLVQVAAVHVVERPGAGPLARLAERIGLKSGTAYLALSFHNGRAIKLPRTSRRFGLSAVRRMADWIEAQQTAAAQARWRAQVAEAQAQARAARVDTAALAPVDDVAEQLRLAAGPPAEVSPAVLRLAARVDDDSVIEVDATVIEKTAP